MIYLNKNDKKFTLAKVWDFLMKGNWEKNYMFLLDGTRVCANVENGVFMASIIYKSILDGKVLVEVPKKKIKIPEDDDTYVREERLHINIDTGEIIYTERSE